MKTKLTQLLSTLNYYWNYLPREEFMQNGALIWGVNANEKVNVHHGYEN
ncbi:hypothetical protein [Maribacter flavus]|nr:hypothetical protein [Maribacter flavus]